MTTPRRLVAVLHSPLLIVALFISALFALSSPVDAQSVPTPTPNPAHVTTCSNGAVVPDTSQTGLIRDCAWLLQGKDQLRGTATTLNWSGSTAITSWTGVTVDSASKRVTWLTLSSQELRGTIPGELGNLANLEQLYLDHNVLKGTIPGELGNLSNLTELYLGYNGLTGTIPGELGNLANLEQLSLENNQLTGTIPGELGNLANLEQLSLENNQLTGTSRGSWAACPTCNGWNSTATS